MKLKQISKRTLSIVLTVLMVFSTLFVGTVSVNAGTAGISGNIYFDDNVTNWSTVYCFIGHGSYLRSYKMSLVSNGIWKTDTSFSSEWTDAGTGVFFASTDGGVTSGSNSYSLSNKPSLSKYTGINYTLATGADSCYIPVSSANDTQIFMKSVLKGDKIMFYYGDTWDSGTKYLRTSTSTSTSSQESTSASATFTCSTNSKTGTLNYCSVTLASSKYYISNSSTWSGVQMSANALGGYAYALGNTGVFGGSTSNHIDTLPSMSGVTLSNTSYTITQGTAASGISATLDNAKSVSGKSNSIVYYYTQDDSNYYAFDPSDASGLAVGTYTVIPVVCDGVIAVKSASTITLEVTTANVSNITAVANPTEGGSVTIDGGTDPVNNVGSDGVAVTATPAAGYQFTKWTTENGSFVAEGSASTTFKPTADNAVATANFSKIAISFTNGNTQALTYNVGDAALALDVAATSTDGAELTYSTTCSSTGVTITGADTSSPTFTANAAGEYTVTTTVSHKTDSAVPAATKTFTVTVTNVTTVNANKTSGKTIIVSYDKSGHRNYVHAWYDGGSDIASNSAMTQAAVTGITGNLYYKDITSDIDTSSSSSIYFITKYTDSWDTNSNWQSKEAQLANFKNGGQAYLYHSSSTDGAQSYDSAALYSPLILKSITYSNSLVGDTATTVEVTPQYGVPYFLSDKSASSNYTLNVYAGSTATGTAIYTDSSVGVNGTFSVNWTPNNDSETQYLTFVLSDGIDEVTYTQDFTVSTTPKFKLTQSGLGSGSVTVTQSGTTVNEGDEVTANTTYLITVTPDTGSGISSVTVNGKTPQELPSNAIISTTAKTYTYTMSDADTGLAVAAEFELIDYTITTTGDTYCTVSANATANYGNTVNFSISVTNDAYKVNTVKITDESGNNISTDVALSYTTGATSGTFTMPDKNVKVVVTTVAKPTYAVTCNTAENGTVAADLAEAYEGQQVTVTATPGSGYVLDAVTVTGTSGASVAVTDGKFTMPNEAVTVTATFKAPSFKILGLDGNWYPDSDGYTSLQTYNNASGPVLTQLEGMSGIYYAHLQNTSGGAQWFRIISNKDTADNEFTSTDANTNISSFSAEKKETAHPCSTSADAWCLQNGDNLYVVFDYNNKQLWSQTTEPKLSDFVSTFTVTINNGSLSCNDDATSTMERGTSYLDGTKGLQSTQHTYDNLSVSFGTDVNKNNLLGYTAGSGYAYKVYGYSILMTYKDGSQGVTSVFGNSKITNNGNGNYTSSYTFPENIKSAEITPVYLLSDELQAARNVKYTTVYLRMKPGENELSNTYEPFYYTWRNLSQTYTDPEDPSTSYTLAKNPNGQWPGQVMLYLDQQETYFALVQGGIDGITFTSEENKLIQTFDFEEFIALQKLGYDHITFDMITSTATYGNTMHSTYGGDGNKTYSAGTTAPTGYNTTFLNEAQLYTNLKGEYIDVFGNKLTDASGNAISRESVVSTLKTGYTLSDELAALYTAMGITDTTAQTWLGGARYGYYDYEKDNLYGMTYAVRVYYFNNTGAMVSQQISGTGTISGGKSPLSTTGQTNGAYAYSTDTITYNYKTSDDYNSSDKSNSLNGTNLKEYKTGYELIPDTYAGVPYLVTYAKENKLTLGDGDHYRYDGRWYYSAEAEKFTVDVKTSELADDGSLQKDADGNLTEITGVGTAYINTDGTTSLEVDQGGTVTFNAYSGNHTFAGWYTSDGKLVSKNAAYSVDNIANNYELFAVFQKIADGNIVVINEILTDDTLNIQPGYGSGTVTATLRVTDKDTGAVTEYGNGEAAPVTDGDTIQWVITATPTAPDYFKNFYSEETMDDGSRYLSKLDAADQLVLNEDGSATYTGVATTWDWLTATGSSKPSTHTINLYSDFQKVSAYATLNYHYKDRFGDMKTYIVKDVLLTSAEVANGYKPDPTKVAKYAPYVGDLYKSFTWNCAENNTGDYGTNKYDKSVVDIYAVPTEAKYIAFEGSYNTDGSVNLSAYDSNSHLRSVNTSVTLNANPTSDGKNFSYWMIYQISSDGKSTLDNGEIFSYNKDITFRSTFNAVYIPVYGETVNPFTTNVQQAVYSREQSTEGDYVYADFLTQFETSVPGVLFKDAVANSNDADTANNVKFGDGNTVTSIKYGLVMERDIAATPYDGTTALSDAAPNLNTANVAANIQYMYENTQTACWNQNYTTGDGTYDYYYNLYDYTDTASSLTEYGRLDYFFKISNTEKNQGRVYNVYSYVYYTYTDKNNVSHTEVVVSNPSVLSIYAAGTKTLNTGA